MQYYIFAFTCSWYVSNTYHSPVYFHTNSTYFIRSTPVYWTRLGRNFYVTNTYLPSSYSKLGMNILLRTRYVATDLVTSQNFQPIRCAFALFHFGRTRDVYVATRIILLSSTAEGSATGGYVVATERSGQIEVWASKNVERAREKPSFVPKVD